MGSVYFKELLEKTGSFLCRFSITVTGQKTPFIWNMTSKEHTFRLELSKLRIGLIFTLWKTCIQITVKFQTLVSILGKKNKKINTRYWFPFHNKINSTYLPCWGRIWEIILLLPMHTKNITNFRIQYSINLSKTKVSAVANFLKIWRMFSAHFQKWH